MSRYAFLVLCLLILTSCNTGSNLNPQASPNANQPGTRLPSPTPLALSELLQTEQLLMMTPLSASNLADLAKRLQSRSLVHNNQVAPPNGHVGDEAHFWVYNQDTQMYKRVTAHLILITAHLFQYVEDGEPFNQEALQISAESFENQVYLTSSAAFGNRWSTEKGGNAHLTVLNTIALGHNVGGTFSPLDAYPASVIPYSNQRPLVYLNLDGEIPGSADYSSTLANEFQHLVDWHENPLTPTWMDNGLATLAQHRNNYSTDGVDQTFLQTADTQLNGSPEASLPQAAYRGAGYLFMDYFAEHYGGYGILQKVLADPAAPPANFDDILTQENSPDRFPDVLRKWLVANVIADPSIDRGEFGYPDIHLSGVKAQHTVNAYPFTEQDQVHQYAAEYYNLPGHASKNGQLTIQFTGSPTVRLIGNDPLNSSDEWWGGGDTNIDTTLTRNVDLSSLKGQRATLQFATWFDLVPGHDFAFIEVSTNGGTDWTTLQGPHTAMNNSAGINWGYGYSGISGGGLTPSWMQEQVDLTPYAGQKIKLRFEELTDNTPGLQGFALDQIRIPEIHFQDTLTTDNGWTSNGFARSHAILPEHYIIQAIVYTNTTILVKNLSVDLATARGALTISQFGNQVTRVVLVVAAYALKTSLLASYQLEIHTT